MKATAKAPANIAFIKYWGKKDKKLRLPYNPSISMNLSQCMTTTTVEFSDMFTNDSVIGADPSRVLAHVDRLRSLAGIHKRVRVETKNTFPSGAGIASSASGFAALTVAACSALGLEYSQQELTALARIGSGSACRSIPDGFVKWEEECAYSLYPANYWDIRDIIVIVSNETKKISSSAGHETVQTSPYFTRRLSAIPKRIEIIEHALKEKNFRLFGEVMEEECLDMHHVMQTQTPPLMYWNEETREIMNAVKRWRNEGLPVYFTIDAGPNVHILCEGKNEKVVVEKFSGKEIIVNKPAIGARLI